MDKRNVRVGQEIISSLNNSWIVIKKYSPDVCLIRLKGSKTVCCLSSGQYGTFTIRKRD